MTRDGSRLPPPLNTRGRGSLPSWFGSSRPWRDPSAPRRRLSVRRHGVPALVALVVASGIGLGWPADLRLISTQRSGVAAEPSASPVSGAAGTSLSPASASATADPAATPGSASPSPGASNGPGAPGGAVSPDLGTSAVPTPALVAVAGLPSNPARRRAQAWEAPPPPWTLDGYQWPLPKGRITDPFGPSPWGSRVVNGQLFHDGIDIATFCGDRIVAAHGGVVLAAGRKFDDRIGWVGDLGPYTARLDEKGLWWTLPITVVIDDGNGYRSIYAHFYQVVVKPGQRVRAGQLLGYEGATGRATGCHLHYGLFAPHETATFAIEPAVVKRMLVPPLQIARIDPLLVLPKRPGDEVPAPSTGPGSAHGLAE